MYRAANTYFAEIIFFLVAFIAFSIPAASQEPSKDIQVRDLNRQAIDAVNEKRFSEAIDLLNKAIALDPRYSVGYLNLGSAYLLSGRPELAIEHVKKGLELDPKSYAGFNQLGAVYDKLGKHDKALENFNRAVEINPEYALGYRNIAAVHLWTDKIKPAREAIERSLKIEPNSEESRMLMGVVLARQSKYAEAIKEVRGITEKNPKNELANLLLCQIYLMTDDRASALNMYQSFKSTNTALADAMFKAIFADKVVIAPQAFRP